MMDDFNPKINFQKVKKMKKVKSRFPPILTLKEIKKNAKITNVTRDFINILELHFSF